MKTIIWDIDDVLNNLTETWFTGCFLPTNSACGLSYADLSDNPPCSSLQISMQDYLASIDAYRSVADSEMEPRWTILDWLWHNGAAYRHVALTSRPLSAVSSASYWVFRHLGSYVRTVAVAPKPIPREVPQFDRDKISYLRWLGHFTVLVDDDINVVGAARRAGLRAVLFPQPWNQCRDTVDQCLGKLSALLSQ